MAKLKREDISDANDEIEKLPQKKRKEFEEAYNAISSGEGWLAVRGLDPDKTSQNFIRKILYDEMIGKDYSFKNCRHIKRN